MNPHKDQKIMTAGQDLEEAKKSCYNGSWTRSFSTKYIENFRKLA